MYRSNLILPLPSRWLWLALALALGLPAQAQVASVRDTLFAQPGDTIELAHRFLAPFSDSLTTLDGRPVPADFYRLEYARGRLILGNLPVKDTAWVLRYRYFVEGLPRRLSLRNLKLTLDTTRQEIPPDAFLTETVSAGQEVFWETEAIRKSGSLSRGLTVGNNRSATVTSGLRLQLEGELDDGLTIAGALTDDNLPIQPDGTTQQISDFDRIFIKLMKDPWAVTLGDFEVSQTRSRFTNYYRNVQGVQASYAQGGTKASVSGAVAKGKFHTNAFMGQDGVSGPYRLTGQNGERFFIVLAGSEKVYLNGELMQRGESNDYVIDYNRAEVTFTARHVITNITRIVVDFEYNDRYFNRSLVVGQASQALLKDKLNLHFSYARDADNPNAPFDDPAGFEAVRDSLSRVGDDLDAAVTSGVRLAGYDEDELRYALDDTLVLGDTISYYRFSRDPERAIYDVRFSFVGENEGSYAPDVSGVNANVFRWVGPGRGTHEPVRRWVLPRLLEVAGLSADWQASDKLRVQWEGALSNEDRNRLSSLDDDDNLDGAQRLSVQAQELKLGDSLRLQLEGAYQYVGARYTNLDRVYQREYDRVWDLDPDEGRGNEQIGEGKMRLDWRRKLAFEAEGGYRLNGPGREADRQVLTLRSQWPRWLQGFYTLTHIRNRNDTLQRYTDWWRHEGDVFVPLGNKLRLGTVLWAEDKQERRVDSTGQGTFSFLDLKPYLRTVDTEKLQLDAYFNYRLDRAFLRGEKRDKSEAYTYYLQLRYQPVKAFSVQTLTSWRDLRVRDTAFLATGLQDSRTLATNWQMNYTHPKRLLNSTFVYDVSSEQLARQEVRFLQVNPGQGQYVWLDSLFDDDGVQDFEEFQLANNPLVADFIRVVVPTRELFPTTRLSFSGNLRWDLRRMIGESDLWWKETLRQFRAITTFRLTQNKQRTESGGADYLIDLFSPFADTTLRNANYNFRQDFTLFQNSPTGDLRFTYLDNQSKLFLASGDEFNGFSYLAAAQRLNLSRSVSLEHELRRGRKFVRSAGFASRNFDMAFLRSEPKVNLQFNRKLRVSAGYEFRYRENTNLEGLRDAIARVHQLNLDAKFNLKDRNNIFVRAELSSLIETGAPAFSAQYELRQGLQPGFNLILQAFVTYYLLSNVELSVTYDGRLSADVAPIHTGRVQVRAFF